MNWLNPAIWWMATAASVPLLLYLLSRRRLKRLPFPTLRFLLELEKKQHRRVKITQWLLILLRILAVLCLVAAFARPLMTGALSAGTPAATEVVAILDRSASMGSRSSAGTPFDQAVRALQALASTLDRQDHITLLFADQFDTTRTPASTAAIRSELDGASPYSFTSDISFAMKRAEKILAKSPAPFRSIVVFTDAATQADTLLPAQSHAENIRRFLWRPSQSPDANFAITQLELLEPFTPEGALAAVTVHSYAQSTKSVTVRLSISTDGGAFQPSAERTVELASLSEQKIEWQLTASGEGPWRIRAELSEDDALPLDNRREIALPKQSRAPLAITGDAAAVAVLTRTLDALDQPHTGASQSAQVTLHAGDHPPATSPIQWVERLQSGQRLWLIPSSKADAAEWNRWLAGLGGITLQRYEATAGRGVYTVAPAPLGKLLQGWIRTPTIAVTGRWQIAGGSSSLRFDDGAPAWCELAIGAGLLRIEAIPLMGAGWENHPVRLPLMAKGISLLSSQQAAPVLVCAPSVKLPSSVSDRAEWISPSGKKVTAVQQQLDLLETGIWSGKPDGWLSVVSPQVESDLRPAARIAGVDASQWKTLPSEPTQFVTAWKQQRDGRELRTILLAVALLLLCAESILSRGNQETSESTD